jgi:hypothetical protein
MSPVTHEWYAQARRNELLLYNAPLRFRFSFRYWPATQRRKFLASRRQYKRAGTAVDGLDPVAVGKPIGSCYCREQDGVLQLEVQICNGSIGHVSPELAGDVAHETTHVAQGLARHRKLRRGVAHRDEAPAEIVSNLTHVILDALLSMTPRGWFDPKRTRAYVFPSWMDRFQQPGGRSQPPAGPGWHALNNPETGETE